MSNYSPLVSIGVPVYNEENHLEEALHSLLSQTHQNTEIIISDNASTDRTQSICQEFASQDKRIIYHRQVENKGSAANFNTVVHLATGEYFMFAAGHDLWHPTFISSCLDLMVKDSSIVLCYPQAAHIDAEGKVLSSIPCSVDTRGLRPLNRILVVLWGVGYAFPIYGLTRRKYLKKASLELKIIGVDVLMLCELSYYGTLAHIPKPLLFMRKLPDFGDWDSYMRKIFGKDVSLQGLELYQDMKTAFISRLVGLFHNNHQSYQDKLSRLISESLDLTFFRSDKSIPESPQPSSATVAKEEVVSPKIMIDAVFFQLYKSGIGRVWISLFYEWVKSGFSKHLIVLDRANTAPNVAGIKKYATPAFNPANPQADRLMLQSICDKENPDVFISSYYTTPLKTPSVFMGYDMIPETLPQYYNLEDPIWKGKHNAIKQATHYITISQNTATDLIRIFPNIDLREVTVAHCGVDSLFSPASEDEIAQFKYRYGISKPYFLIVGGRVGYKNGILSFQGFEHLKNRFGFDVVCTGPTTSLEPQLRDLSGGLMVHLLKLEDQELRVAYSGALALLYPSRYEGFGLPILEAFACGCPVITCRTSSIPEIAEEAAIYVDPDSPESMAEALLKVQKTEVREVLIARGLERARQFSWSKMARLVQDVLVTATLEYLDLRLTNIIAFPDWSCLEEGLWQELVEQFTQIFRDSDRKDITLLLVTDHQANSNSLQDLEILLNDIVMMVMINDEALQVAEDLPNVTFIHDLSEIQWDTLFSHLSYRLFLSHQTQDHPQWHRFSNLSVWKGEGLTSDP